jgi:hypothetical protein
VFIKQHGVITPEVPAPTTQILVVAQAQIRQGKVAPGVFVKQLGVITPELLVLTFKASTGNNMEDDQELQAE